MPCTPSLQLHAPSTEIYASFVHGITVPNARYKTYNLREQTAWNFVRAALALVLVGGDKSVLADEDLLYPACLGASQHIEDESMYFKVSLSRSYVQIHFYVQDRLSCQLWLFSERSPVFSCSCEAVLIHVACWSSCGTLSSNGPDIWAAYLLP